MKLLSFAATATALLATLGLAAPQQTGPGLPEPVPIGKSWRLHVSHYRMARPEFTGSVDIRGGLAVINWDPKFRGFFCHVLPLPRGRLTTEHSRPLKGYLERVPGKPDLYDLKFAQRVPSYPRDRNRIKHTNFYPTKSYFSNAFVDNSLMYDETPNDDKVKGTWLVYQMKGFNQAKNGPWGIRYWLSDAQRPADHNPAFMWRSDKLGNGN